LQVEASLPDRHGFLGGSNSAVNVDGETSR